MMSSRREVVCSASTASPDATVALVQRADVQHRFAEPLRVLDLEVGAARGADGAAIADLPALLAVEVRAVEQERDALARGELPDVTTALSFTQPSTFARAGSAPNFGASSVAAGRLDRA
jgi:hypothetical protein